MPPLSVAPGPPPPQQRSHPPQSGVQRRRWLVLLPFGLPLPFVATAAWRDPPPPRAPPARDTGATPVAHLFAGHLLPKTALPELPDSASAPPDPAPLLPPPPPESGAAAAALLAAVTSAAAVATVGGLAAPPGAAQREQSAAGAPPTDVATPGSPCVAWRQTAGCDPHGPRESQYDRSCLDLVQPGASGYCDCGSGLRAAESPCGHAAFTCSARCRELSLRRPSAGGPAPTQRAPVGPGRTKPRAPGGDPKQAVFGRADESFEEGKLRFRSTPDGGLWTPNERALRIRETTRKAFAAYRKFAWGCDEVERRGCKMWDRTNMQMATLVDSLSTLWICGLREEFWQARELVRTKWKFTPSGDVGVFETTIRILGGMLAAGALSGDELFFRKAREVGEALAGAFAPGKLAHTGYPFPLWNPHTSRGRYFPWMPGTHSLAEVGSVQLEFRFLSHVTGKYEYDDHVTAVMDRLEVEARRRKGVIPGQNRGTWSGAVSFGAYSDSYYEYLLKQWLLTGRAEQRYLDMYTEMLNTALGGLIANVGNRSVIAAGGSQGGAALEHLTCFAGGMMALGHSRTPTRNQQALEVGARLARTCAEMYNTPTGLAPDMAVVTSTGLQPRKRNFPLRPETSESLFYLWRETKDPWYRERSWAIYEGVERHASLGADEGYSEVLDVFAIPARHSQKMDTFFTAELLKYLFLMQADDAALSLDCWVFNTEAHPLPVIPARKAAAGLAGCTYGATLAGIVASGG
eukprot:TRINITY_DN7470_c0_g1_i1.p1 TRINITY_DN7470_c0_g1~~TRINITY_DN7470_c0_g1_i1.p1  ORF type:complete len:789 (+),score=161.35 TRINITY_DN7470_c0_g1_i1:132-2369(+)